MGLPLDQVHFERTDWKKNVFALVDYAYRALAPDTTWQQAIIMAKTAIDFALDPENDDWDPSKESLLKHIGRELREIVFVVRDQRGTGREARRASPDWSHAARARNATQMMAALEKPEHKPLTTEEFFRAKRRLRETALEVMANTRANLKQ